MAFWSRAKEEDVLESLVGGVCWKCRSEGSVLEEHDHASTYRTLSCDACGEETVVPKPNIHGKIK